jgi:nitroreductase
MDGNSPEFPVTGGNMTEILKLIQERQSTRAPFDPRRSVSGQDLRHILEAGRWAPTAHNMQNFEILLVDDKDLLKAIADMKSPISEVFIRENYRQLSSSEEELLKKKVGLLGTMFPPPLRHPGAKLDSATREQLAAFQGRLIQTCSALLIVLYDPSKRAPASKGDFLGIISLGCVMENMWLMAQSLGIGFHIVSAISAPPIEKEAKKLLSIPQNLRIAFSVRLGYAVSPVKQLRVRRNIEDFTHHNRFGVMGLD